MFWKNKQKTGVAVDIDPTGTVTAGAKLPETKVEALKTEVEKLHGPTGLPELVGREIVVSCHKDPDWVWNTLKAVVRQNPKGKKVFDVRVFSDSAAQDKHIKVKDYTTFDEHPELILFEGWFDKETYSSKIVERKTG